MLHSFFLCRYLQASILLLSFCGGNAQPYYFKHYQVENGLSNNTVYSSAQDKHGFLWFGTKEGLNRFDGYHFKLFTSEGNTDNGNINEQIYCLFADPKGELWVGSQKGLYRFDEKKESLVRYMDSLQDISALQMDKKGRLWFLSRNKVYRYDPISKTVRFFPPERYFVGTSICLSEEGEIWCSTADGFLRKFDPLTETFTGYDLFAHSPPASSRWTQQVRAAGKGQLLIGTTSQGLKKFDITTNAYTDIFTGNPDKTNIYVRDLIQYSGDEFWLATESGIYILNIKSGRFINLRKQFLDPYSLSDNAVYSLCKDSEGGVWAGTYFGGLNHYTRQYSFFQKYFPDNRQNSISGNAVREICEDQYHDLWIGTEDAGLNKLNPVTGHITHFNPEGTPTSIAYSNIHGLMATGNDLWIGTFEHGLDIMDIRTGKVKKHFMAGPGSKDLKSNFILCFLKTSSGELLVGASNGVCKYDEKTDGFGKAAGLPDNIFISALLEDHNKTIWAGTHGQGIFYFNPLTGRKGHMENDPNDKNSLSNDMINAIYEDSRNNLLISTEGGGLCQLDSGRAHFSAWTRGNGLPSNLVFKVIEDDHHHLWVSTSKGLADLEPDHKSLTVYTSANGLLNDQFNYSSGFKDAGGKVYFGSVKGMISFRPDDLFPNQFVPPVHITGFQVNNQELPIGNSGDSSFLKESIIYTDKITLPYDQSSFSIDFAALSYTSPERTEYLYKMEGLDKEWTSLKSNRKVYFTNLSPGKYVFSIKANANGSWSGKEKQLTLVIRPPFWATGWAYSVYVLLTLTILYFLISGYHNKMEIKKEKEIYEAKLDFFTNIAHEIRTPLTLIKGPVDALLEMAGEVPEIKEEVMTMDRNANRLIALVSQILDFRQTETKGFSLDFAKVNVSEILREAYLTFSPPAKKKNLVFTIDLPSADVYAFADEEALQKIFSNLFSNAVKYALQGVQVRLLPLQKEDSCLVIEISNDGAVIPPELKERIFEPFYRLKETSRQKGTGIGLALARLLTELHKGKLNLKDPSTGLNTFIFSIPLQPEQSIVGKLKTPKRLNSIK